LCCVKRGKGKIISVFSQPADSAHNILLNYKILKRKLLQVLQFVVFLGIGVGLFFWLYRKQDFSTIMDTIRNQVDWKWIILSLGLGVLSHLSRALRWKMLIDEAEAPVKWYNAFMAVLIGYLANLAFPRMGEVTRCGVVSKYEKVSFTRVAGTVLAERLTDLLFLLSLILLAFVLEYDHLSSVLSQKLSFARLIDLFTSVWWWLFVICALLLVWYIMRRAFQMAVFRRVKGLWEKFREGLMSVMKLKQKKTYLFYSFFLWLMYFMMQYVCFFAMPDTSSLTVKIALVVLVTGSIGMLAPVQGGIGPWHAMVIATLMLYGVTEDPACAFALVVHGAQNLLVAVLGLLSFVLLPVVNRHSKVKV
jgi:uncharacterized protein (TIRG00374 family)